MSGKSLEARLSKLEAVARVNAPVGLSPALREMLDGIYAAAAESNGPGLSVETKGLPLQEQLDQIYEPRRSI